MGPRPSEPFHRADALRGTSQSCGDEGQRVSAKHNCGGWVVFEPDGFGVGCLPKDLDRETSVTLDPEIQLCVRHERGAVLAALQCMAIAGATVRPLSLGLGRHAPEKAVSITVEAPML